MPSQVRVYLRWHKFPTELTTRVKRYYEFYFSRKSAMDEDEILNGLAPALRKEVSRRFCRVRFHAAHSRL